MTPGDRSAPGDRLSGLVPAWLANLEAFGWRVLVVVALAVVLVWFAMILITETASLVLSAVIAAAAAPVAIALRARGVPRVRAALAAWAVAGAVIVGGLAFVVIAFVPYIADLLRALQQGLEAIRSGSVGITVPLEISSALERVAAVVSTFLQDQVGELVERVSMTATIAILSTFLTFFILLDASRGADWALQGVPPASRAELRDRGRDAALRVGGLMRATAAASAVRTAAMLAVMLLLGTPYAGPLAALLLVGGLVPYLGTLAASLAIVLVALGGQGLGSALLVLAAAFAVEVSISIGRRRLEGAAAVRVHPAVALLALPLGAIAAGVIGMILAVPVAAFLQLITGRALAAFEPQLPTISSAGPVVPGWLDRLARWSRGLLVGIALLFAFVALTIQLSDLVLAVVLAAVLAATLAPAASVLRRRGAGPTAAALGSTVALISGIGIILALTVASLARDIDQMVADASAGSSSVDQAAPGALAWLPDLVAAISGGILDTVIAFAAVPSGIVLGATLTATLTFFLLRDGGVAWRWATARLTGWRRREVDAAGVRAAGVLGGYMVATGVISAFGAATQFAIMAVLGLPLALPLAVLSFFGGFIPYIGSFITTGLAFLVTVAVGSPTDIAVMAIFTLVFNIVTGNFVAPLVYGKAVSIHPAVVLVAIPAGSTIAGVFGMFIVVPLIGVVVATWRTALSVLGDAPADPAPGASGPGDVGTDGGAGPATDEAGDPPPARASTT